MDRLAARRLRSAIFSLLSDRPRSLSELAEEMAVEQKYIRAHLGVLARRNRIRKAGGNRWEAA